MSRATVEQILSAALVFSALFIWLKLIFHRRNTIGGAEDNENLDAVIDVFRRGITVLRTHPALVIVPLTAQVIGFLSTLPSTYSFIKKHPSLDGSGSIDILYSLLHSLPRMFPDHFFRAAGGLDSAVLAPFLSWIVILTFLVIVTVILFKNKGTGEDDVDGRESKRQNYVAGLAGLAALVFAAMFVIGLFVKRESPLHLYHYLVVAPNVVAMALAFAVMLGWITAAIREERFSIIRAISTSDSYFVPLFFYVLFSAGLGLVVELQLYSSAMFGGSGVSKGLLLPHLKRIAGGIVIAMISFIPTIIVVEQSTFRSALLRCIDLWAIHGRRAATFVIAGILMLLALIIVKDMLDMIFHNFFWGRQIASFLVSLARVAIGAWIMTAMVVLLTILREPNADVPATSC